MNYIDIFDAIMELDNRISSLGGASEEKKLKQLEKEINDVWLFFVDFWKIVISSPITVEEAKQDLSQLHAWYYVTYMAVLRNKEQPRKLRKKLLVQARKVWMYEVVPVIEEILDNAASKHYKNEFMGLKRKKPNCGQQFKPSPAHEKELKERIDNLIGFKELQKNYDYKTDIEQFFKYGENVLRGMIKVYMLVYRYPYLGKVSRHNLKQMFPRFLESDFYDNSLEIPKDLRKYYFVPTLTQKKYPNVDFPPISISQNIKIFTHKKFNNSSILDRLTDLDKFIKRFSDNIYYYTIHTQSDLNPEIKKITGKC